MTSKSLSTVPFGAVFSTLLALAIGLVPAAVLIALGGTEALK